MSTYIQLIGSIVIGSIFLLGVLTFYGNMIDYQNQKLFEQLTQESAASFMEIIEHDFYKIGNGAIPPGNAITNAWPFEFIANVDNDPDMELVRYDTSTAAQGGLTPNPNDVILYRIVDSDTTITVPAGVRRFLVALLDLNGNPTADLSAVKMLDVSLDMESIYEYRGAYTPANRTYARAFWQIRVSPPNLN